MRFEADQHGCVFVWLDVTRGTLHELREIKRSFDYQAYTFGNLPFRAAVWDTGYRADDHRHKKYPERIQIGDRWGTWDELEAILLAGGRFGDARTQQAA